MLLNLVLAVEMIDGKLRLTGLRPHGTNCGNAPSRTHDLSDLRPVHLLFKPSTSEPPAAHVLFMRRPCAFSVVPNRTQLRDADLPYPDVAFREAAHSL